MITVTGWTLDTVDDLPFIEAMDLATYWQRYPPVHILVALAIGYQSPIDRGPDALPAPKPSRVESEVIDVLSGNMRPESELPPAVLQFVRGLRK